MQSNEQILLSVYQPGRDHPSLEIPHNGNLTTIGDLRDIVDREFGPGGVLTFYGTKIPALAEPRHVLIVDALRECKYRAANGSIEIHLVFLQDDSVPAPSEHPAESDVHAQLLAWGIKEPSAGQYASLLQEAS